MRVLVLVELELAMASSSGFACGRSRTFNIEEFDCGKKSGDWGILSVSNPLSL